MQLAVDPMIDRDEAFNVACGLAGQELDRFVPEVAEEYYCKLDRPFPVPDEASTVAVDEPPAQYGAAT